MGEYYGVVRVNNQNELSHYGIRGMKWGVRRALRRGDYFKVDKHYDKAVAKLSKLQNKVEDADILEKKYRRKAARRTAGAIASAGLAALGTKRAADVMRFGGNAVPTVSNFVKNIAPGSVHNSAAFNAANEKLKNANLGEKMNKAADAVETWGKSKNVGRGAAATVRNTVKIVGGNTMDKSVREIQHRLRGLNNDQIARIGALGLSAGLAASAAYNRHKAKTSRTKNARKLARYQRAMRQAFRYTDYADKV